MARPRRPSGPTTTLSCPSCGTRFVAPKGARGRARCKKCGEAFSLARAKDSGADNRYAMRMVIVGVSALLVIIGIVSLASKTPTPGSGKEKPNKNRSSSTPSSLPSTPEPSPPPAEPEKPPLPPQKDATPPKVVAVDFLRAIVDQQRDEVARRFEFTRYFEIAEKKYDRKGEFPRYATLDEAARRSQRELHLDDLMDVSVRGPWLQYLLTSLEAGEDKMLVQTTAEDTRIVYSYAMTKGGTVFMRLNLVLQRFPEAWKVVNMLATQPGAEREDKKARPVDVGWGMRRLVERQERKKRGGLAPEAEPYDVKPLAGTSRETEARIREKIAVVLDRDETVRANQAKFDLVDIGPPAIPFLLMELKGRNHVDDDDDIFASLQVCMVLREITNKRNFGYGPRTNASARPNPLMGGRPGGQSLAGATPEKRQQAVRRWFGWWKTEGPRFIRLPYPPEPEGEEEDDF